MRSFFVLSTSSSNYMNPPLFNWDAVRLKNQVVELLFTKEQKNHLNPFLEEKVSFISLPKGKQFHFKSFEKKGSAWVANVKGLSLKDAENQRIFSLSSYPWIYTTSAIIAIPNSERNIFFLREMTVFYLKWQGIINSVPAHILYLGQDKYYSLWKICFKGIQRLCLGSFYTFSTQWGEGRALVLSGMLSEFKTKRQSLGLFLKGASSLEAFLNFRLSFGALSCPVKSQSLLPSGQVKQIGIDFFLKKSYYESLKVRVFRIAKTFGGVHESFISERLGGDKELVSLLLKYWKRLGLLMSSEGFYWQVEGVQNRLSPLAKAVLTRVEKQGEEGISLGSLRSRGEKETLKTLHRLGLVAGYLPEEFFFSLEALKNLKIKLWLISPHLHSSLAQIREWLGISRKAAVSLCESLRERGILEREEKDWIWVARSD